jgi:hypothetical protein
MTILLLCGYRDRDETEKALFYHHIDSQIRQLRWLGLEVVCVLAGAHADDQLRYCRRIAESEMVFDTTETPNLASNLKAGLAGTDGSGCFVLPVEVPAPPPEVFAFLRESWRVRGFLTETNIYQMISEEGAPSHYGFPLLVTRSGNSTIKRMEGFRSLLDTRLKYSGLASMELPL